MPQKSLSREYFEALLIAVIFATFARTYVVQAFKIPTGSMEKTLLVGDHILVNKFIYGPTRTALERRLLPVRDIERGDIVVFKYPKDPARGDFIKRCVGVPGDTIEVVHKDLMVNGRKVEDAGYTYHFDAPVSSDTLFLYENRPRDNFGPFTVPSESYFCMGDNRDNSNDSRFWGTVPLTHVKGRALLVYWSFASEGEPIEWPGFAGKLRQLGRVAARFFTATRWQRSFRVVR